MTFEVEDFFNRPLNESDTFSDSSTTVTKDINVSERQKLDAFLVFCLGSSFYALAAASIKAVVCNPKLSRLPFFQNKNCLGFQLYSGTAVPVIDIARILNQPQSAKFDRCVLVESKGLLSGVIPDSILGVEQLEVSKQIENLRSTFRLIRAKSSNLTVSVIDPVAVIEAVSMRSL